MDDDSLTTRFDTTQSSGYDREARDFGLTFANEGWLEEHVRQMGSD